MFLADETARRQRKECPECGTKVVELPCHIRLRHQWTDERARAVTSLFSLREKYVYKAENAYVTINKNYHVPPACPITGCKLVVQRMSPHLTGFQKIPSNSETLQLYLLHARKMHARAKFTESEPEEMAVEDEPVNTPLICLSPPDMTTQS